MRSHLVQGFNVSMLSEILLHTILISSIKTISSPAHKSQLLRAIDGDSLYSLSDSVCERVLCTSDNAACLLCQTFLATLAFSLSPLDPWHSELYGSQNLRFACEIEEDAASAAVIHRKPDHFVISMTAEAYGNLGKHSSSQVSDYDLPFDGEMVKNKDVDHVFNDIII